MKPWKSRRWLKLWGVTYFLLSQGLCILITKLKPLGKILLHKPTVLRLVQYFPHFMDPGKFITVFKTAHHLSLSWDRTINSKPHPNSFKIYFTNTLPSTPWFSNSFHSFGFHLSSSPYMLHTTSIPSLLIWPPKQFLERSIDHRGLDYVVSSHLSLPCHTWAEISSSVPCFQKPSDSVPASVWQTKFHTVIRQKTNL